MPKKNRPMPGLAGRWVPDAVGVPPLVVAVGAEAVVCSLLPPSRRKKLMGEADFAAEGSGVVAAVLAALGAVFCASGPETRCGPSSVLAALAAAVPFRGVVAAACALGLGRLVTTSSVFSAIDSSLSLLLMSPTPHCG